MSRYLKVILIYFFAFLLADFSFAKSPECLVTVDFVERQQGSQRYVLNLKVDGPGTLKPASSCYIGNLENVVQNFFAKRMRFYPEVYNRIKDSYSQDPQNIFYVSSFFPAHDQTVVLSYIPQDFIDFFRTDMGLRPVLIGGHLDYQLSTNLKQDRAMEVERILNVLNP